MFQAASSSTVQEEPNEELAVRRSAGRLPLDKQTKLREINRLSGEERLELLENWDISAAPEINVNEAVEFVERNGVPSIAWRTGHLPEELLFRWFTLVVQIQVYRPGWQWRKPWSPNVYYKFISLLMTRTGHATNCYLERYKENDIVVWMSTTREKCRYILGVVRGPNSQYPELLNVTLLPAGPLPRMTFALKPSSLVAFDIATSQKLRRDLVRRDGMARRDRVGKPLPARLEDMTQRQWVGRMRNRWAKEFKMKPGWKITVPIGSQTVP
jgi:hypothetical protein